MKDLSPQERGQFQASDKKEWEAIEASGAVKVWRKTEADILRQHQPSRIITSRMVRRWKPVEGTSSAPLAKSRWCVHGHQDPDTHLLKCVAPPPLTESMLLFLQVAISMDFEVDFADVKSAFTQSDPM